VGQRNVIFVKRYLEAEGLKLMASDVGDIYPRQLQFFPVSGRVRVRQLRTTRDNDLAANEQQYLKRLANDPIKGEVELF
jgi:chemotaxis protein CheD